MAETIVILEEVQPEIIILIREVPVKADEIVLKKRTVFSMGMAMSILLMTMVTVKTVMTITIGTNNRRRYLRCLHFEK